MALRGPGGGGGGGEEWTLADLALHIETVVRRECETAAAGVFEELVLVKAELADVKEQLAEVQQVMYNEVRSILSGGALLDDSGNSVPNTAILGAGADLCDRRSAQPPQPILPGKVPQPIFPGKGSERDRPTPTPRAPTPRNAQVGGGSSVSPPPPLPKALPPTVPATASTDDDEMYVPQPRRQDARRVAPLPRQAPPKTARAGYARDTRDDRGGRRYGAGRGYDERDMGGLWDERDRAYDDRDRAFGSDSAYPY